MQIEEKREGKNPFKEHCDSSMFFSGGGRGALFDDLKAAFQGDVDLITLIGEEGSGKTMLCKMLQEQWETPCKVLFVPQMVGSFEEIVRVAVKACGGEFPEETNRVDARKIFLELVASLRNQGSSLLLLCDEAEKLYLATLERIRKILDDVNREGGGLQVLLSGRASLRANLEQLALCNFEQISEKQFFLSPLDENDTWKYLNFCVQDQEEEEQREVFTREAAEKIASMARGNLRMINILADESLRSSTADTSFLVLLDHVRDSCSIEDIIPASSGGLQRLPFSPKYLIPVGVGLVFLLFFVLFSGDDEKAVTESGGAPGETVAVAPQVGEQPAMEHGTVAEVGSPGKPPVLASPEGEISSPVTLIVPPARDGEPSLPSLTTSEPGGTGDPWTSSPEQPPLAAPAVSVEESPLQSSPGAKENDLLSPPVAVESAGGERITVRPVETVEQGVVEPEEHVVLEPEANSVPPQYTPVEISPVEIVEAGVVEQDVPELLASAKILPPGRTEGMAMEQEKPLPVEPETVIFVQEEMQEQDPILGKLIRAGKEWQAGAMDDQFTIQLMVLTSNQAEGNLKQIITRDEYKEVVDDLVVLRRPSDPPVVLVFYGLYPTMAAARNARNNMPIALRSHHPYAVSVRGAVEKGRLE